ncbi:lipoprotein intramolecular transacylase Lit [Adlercreutzia sp. ZJ141]|uniref:lipoprotein intramolecular transacylase Lit n=1 Tax=Adlercreutzia sp. ZJ141 TaxID=2709406 RepID=UPI0013EACADF|nr:DUF1461 domain-containing protein [Adlercreutzia sp. ZJ141]
MKQNSALQARATAETTTNSSTPLQRALRALVCAALACALAVALVAAGLGACLLPSTTRLLSENTSAFELSPYVPDSLTELACVTRDFTVNDFGRDAAGNTGAQTALATQVVNAAKASAADGSPTHDRWNANARTVLATADDDPAPDVTMERLASVSDAYALDTNAVSHLNDCNTLIRGVMPWLWACAIASLAALAALHLANTRHPWCASVAWKACIAAPVVIVACFAALGAWAVFDFNGLFAAFHGVFFPQGNWMFSYESLLICMYPIDFWVGMAAIWAATTVTACIICLLVGRVIRKKDHHAR